jgi:hypothetical protein
MQYTMIIIDLVLETQIRKNFLPIRDIYLTSCVPLSHRAALRVFRFYQTSMNICFPILFDLRRPIEGNSARCNDCTAAPGFQLSVGSISSVVFCPSTANNVYKCRVAKYPRQTRHFGWDPVFRDAIELSGIASSDVSHTSWKRLTNMEIYEHEINGAFHDLCYHG